MDTGQGDRLVNEPRRRDFALPTLGGDARLAGLDFGDPDRPLDLIFLHANGFNAMTYRTLLAPLAGRLRMLAIDLPGHGHSPQRVPVEGRTSWTDMVDDIWALLQVLAPPAPVVLAGHSIGGATALFTAADHPEAVKGLALFDPVIMSPPVVEEMRRTQGRPHRGNPLAEGADRRRAVFPDRAAVLESYRGRGAFKTWPEAALADYVTDGFKDRPDGQVELACAPAWEASNFRAHDHDPWAVIARLAVPTTILRASIASTCSLEREDQLPAAVPRRHVETIPDTTHFLPIERPDLARATLLAACKAPAQ